MQSEQNSFIDVRISLENRRVTIITKCNLPVIQMKKTFLCTVFIRFISLFFRWILVVGERCVSFDGLFVLDLEETVWRKYGGGISLSEYPAKRNR